MHKIQIAEMHRDSPELMSEIKRFVIDHLAPLIPEGAKIISIDGFDGVGKSTLARYLASAIHAEGIGLDAFLLKNQNAFSSALRIDDLSRKIGEVLTVSKTVVIEGCCVDLILQRLGLTADTRIYVMKATGLSGCSDDVIATESDILNGGQTADELIAKRQEQSKKMSELPAAFGGGGSGDLPPLEKELTRYHVEYRPHERADILVEVVHWT